MVFSFAKYGLFSELDCYLSCVWVHKRWVALFLEVRSEEKPAICYTVETSASLKVDLFRSVIRYFFIKLLAIIELIFGMTVIIVRVRLLNFFLHILTSLIYYWFLVLFSYYIFQKQKEKKKKHIIFFKILLTFINLSIEY